MILTHCPACSGQTGNLRHRPRWRRLAVAFTKTIAGFTVGGVPVGNGTVGNFSGSAAAYTFGVTPNAVGQAAVDNADNADMDSDE